MRQVRATVSKRATATSLWDAASEADLAPLHRAAERALGSVVGRFHSILIEEREEPFKVHAQRSRQIAHVLVAAVEMIKRESEELLLQWNGFQNQLFSCDRAIASAGSGAKPMPETEQTRVQGEKVA